MTAKEAMRIRNNPTAEDVDNEELQRCIDEALEKQIPKKPKERHSIKWGDSYLTKSKSKFYMNYMIGTHCD